MLKVETGSEQDPETNVTVPKLVAPSKKVTVPVAILLLMLSMVTLALSVTLIPKTEGFGFVVRLVVLVAWVTMMEFVGEASWGRAVCTISTIGCGQLIRADRGRLVRGRGRCGGIIGARR